MLVKDANGKHPKAPGVLYVIHKYDSSWNSKLPGAQLTRVHLDFSTR